MEKAALKKFMSDSDLSANQVGKKSNVATSNLTRVLNGDTKLTKELALRIYTAFPRLIDYVEDEEEKKYFKTSALPAKFIREVDGSHWFLPELKPELRASFVLRSPQNIHGLERYKGKNGLVDTEGTNKKIVLHVIETDLGPRIMSGDIVVASIVEEETWMYVHGVIFIVFANYSMIKKVLKNNLAEDKPTLEIISDGTSIVIPRNDIKQIFQLDSIVTGRLSF